MLHKGKFPPSPYEEKFTQGKLQEMSLAIPYFVERNLYVIMYYKIELQVTNQKQKENKIENRLNLK